MAVEGQTTALLNRFTDPKYQRCNWNHLETTIVTTVDGLIPPTVTLSSTELQTLAQTPSAINNPNSTEFLTLISQSINRTSAELLSLNQNLIRGRGVFCKACFEYQRHDHAAFAALVAAVNSKHPQIGHLLLRRLVSDIKEAHALYKHSSLSDLTKFLAHLVNQRVSAESLGFELVNFFLYSNGGPSDAVVMIAVEFIRQCGAALRMSDSDDFDGVLDRLRELLQAKRNSSLYGDISDDDSKVKVIVQSISSLRAAEFRNAVRVIPELDVVSEKERVTHSDISFYDDNRIETERELDSFRYDSEFFDADIARARMEMELIILACEEEPFGDKEAAMQLGQVPVVHNRENETCWLIVSMCVQEDWYKPYFADIGRRMHTEFDTGHKPWKQCFIDVYDKIEEFDEEKKLMNVAKFFGDMMGTKVEWVKSRGQTMVIKGNGIPWEYVFGNLRLWHKSNSDAAKTFLEVMFDQVGVRIGTNARSSMINAMASKTFKLDRIFPTSDVRKLRMWINFFNSIGLRTLTQYCQTKQEGLS